MPINCRQETISSLNHKYKDFTLQTNKSKIYLHDERKCYYSHPYNKLIQQCDAQVIWGFPRAGKNLETS